MDLRDRAIQAACERDHIRDADKERRAVALQARAVLMARQILQIDTKADEWEVRFTLGNNPSPYATMTIEGVGLTLGESGNLYTHPSGGSLVEVLSLADFGDVLRGHG